MTSYIPAAAFISLPAQKPLQGNCKENRINEGGRDCFSSLSSRKPLVNIPPCVTQCAASVKPWQYFDTLHRPFLLFFSFEVHLAAQDSVPLPAWWECLVTGRLWPAFPRTFTPHFSIALGTAANISPAWFAGYRHKSDLGLKKNIQACQGLKLYFLTRTSGK